MNRNLARSVTALFIALSLLIGLLMLRMKLVNTSNVPIEAANEENSAPSLAKQPDSKDKTQTFESEIDNSSNNFPKNNSIIPAASHQTYAISLAGIESALTRDGIQKTVRLKLKMTDQGQDPSIGAMDTVGVWYKLVSEEGNIKLSPHSGSSLSQTIAKSHTDYFYLDSVVKANTRTFLKVHAFLRVIHIVEEKTVEIPTLSALPKTINEQGFEFTYLSHMEDANCHKIILRVRTPNGTPLEPQQWARNFVTYGMTWSDGAQSNKNPKEESGLQNGESLVNLEFKKKEKQVSTALKISFVTRIREERYPFELDNIILPDPIPLPVTFDTAGMSMESMQGFSIKLARLKLEVTSANQSLKGVVAIGIPPSLATSKIYCKWNSVSAVDISGLTHAHDVHADMTSFKRPLGNTGEVALNIGWGNTPARDIASIAGILDVITVEKERDISLELPTNIDAKYPLHNGIESFVIDGTTMHIVVNIEAKDFNESDLQIYGLGCFKIELENNRGERLETKFTGATNNHPKYTVTASISASDFKPVRIHVKYPTDKKTIGLPVKFSNIKLTQGK